MTRKINEELKLHRDRKNIPKKLFDGWKRGVGVHHAYFHTKFRSSVIYDNGTKEYSQTSLTRPAITRTFATRNQN